MRSEECRPSAGSDALTWADLGLDERLNVIEDFLASTEQFERARLRIGACFRRWRAGVDGKLIMLHGLSGSGKTTVADAILDEIVEDCRGIVDPGETGPDEDDVSDETHDAWQPPSEGRLPRSAGVLREGPEGRIRPVVKVFVEPKTRSIRLMRDIARVLGVTPKTRSTYGDLVDLLTTQIAGQKVRMIMLDEIHHMVQGQGADVIKMLLVQLKVQVVGIGLPHATSIVVDNPDLVRHQRHMYPMPAFELDLAADGQWRSFLAALAEAMPFDAKPDFAEKGLALRMHTATGGLVGRVMNLVAAAAEIAIEEGWSTVDVDRLAEAYWEIENVPSAENPFVVGIGDAADCVRRGRAKSGAVPIAGNKRGREPTFKKRA